MNQPRYRISLPQLPRLPTSGYMYSSRIAWYIEHYTRVMVKPLLSSSQLHITHGIIFLLDLPDENVRDLGILGFLTAECGY